MSIWGFVQSLFGATPIPVREAVARYRVCERCPERRSNDRCRVCKCILREKVLVRSERCPLGKW